MTRHKHADIIHAWAEGADVQVLGKIHHTIWYDADFPTFDPEYEYRIKPAPKPDYYRFLVADGQLDFVTSHVNSDPVCKWEHKIKVTYSGKTDEIIAVEIIK